MPYWDDLEYNEADEIDEPEDVTLPSTLHHMQAKAEVDLLVRAGVLTDDEAQAVIKSWRARKELDSGDKVKAAIDALRNEGVVDDEEAADLRERASA